MRQRYVSIFAMILAAGSFLFSCGSKSGNDRMGDIKFDSVMTDSTVHLMANDSNPACYLKINIAYPKSSTDEMLTDSLNYYIVDLCFGDRYAGLNVKEAKAQYTQDYISSYLEDIGPLFQSDVESGVDMSETGSWYSYYRDINGRVQYYDKSLLVYRFYYDEYTGGAHGMHAALFLNIDLATKRPLTLDNIFTGDYKESLTDLIWNQLMTDNDAKSHEELEEMGFGSTGEIVPTDNFYLDKDGITFYYNVYDIAPYAVGETKVTIPFDTLERWLNTSTLLEELMTEK
jgi:hypothetical protein